MDESSTVRDPAARDVLLRQRQAMDELARRAAALTLPDERKADDELFDPGWTPGSSIRSYEAWQLRRGNVVIELPSRHVEAKFARMDEARAHADQLNKWLAARPSPDRRYRLFVPPPEPTEAALLAMIEHGKEIGEWPLESLVATREQAS